MTVYVYDSNDVGAPALTSNAGSLSNLLKICLVGTNGVAYGSKNAAGWTLTVDDTNNILLRNSSTNGSGRYFRIKDDGFQESTQSVASYAMATITGAVNYTDINTLIQPFPRTITGEDRDSTTYYGGVIAKHHPSNVAASRPWRIIADDVTCYLFIAYNTGTSNIESIAVGSESLRLYGFGDLGLIDNVTNYPKAFVSPVIFQPSDAWWINQYGYSMISVGLNGHMEHPLDNQTKSTKMYVQAGISTQVNHGASTSTTSIGYYHLYPSPVTGGVVFENIYVCDDTNNIARTVKHTKYNAERFAYYRGVMACCHSLVSGASYKLGNNWDKVEVGGRTYLVVQLVANGVGGTYAFDLTGPW